MIVYLANKTRFRADILSNRIEFDILRAGKRMDVVVAGIDHRGATLSPAVVHE